MSEERKKLKKGLGDLVTKEHTTTRSEDDYVCPECFYKAVKPCKDRKCELYEERGVQLPSQCKHLKVNKISGCPDCLLTYDEMLRHNVDNICISYGCKDIAVIYYDYCLECIIVGSEE